MPDFKIGNGYRINDVKTVTKNYLVFNLSKFPVTAKSVNPNKVKDYSLEKYSVTVVTSNNSSNVTVRTTGQLFP